MTEDIMQQKSAYGLTELVELINNKKIDIPTIQRGFVWSIHQIEIFWDSLLRGYPVGTLVFNKKKEEFLILDGQQRLTSIYLAFNYDEITDTNLKATNDFYKVFIDLEKPSAEDGENRKFVFRVISKSQPWGMQKSSPKDKLEAESRRKALELYGIKNYYEVPLEKFWPYDAVEPVPFAFFLQAKSVEELKKLVAGWKKKTGFHSDKTSQSKYSLEELWNDIQKMIKNTEVPVVYLDIDKVGNESSDMNGNAEDDSNDEIENLFIRLNSQGTPLTGEELNYCILKSYISVELQNEIEKACFPMFSPARFIIIVFRLFQHKENKNPSFSLKMKPKQFQRNIKEYKDDFSKYLNEIIQYDKIKELEELLSYSPKNTSGLPAFIVYNIAARAPEVMFILLYRLWIKGDKFKTAEEYKRMLGVITTLTWFGCNGNKNEHTKILTNIKDFITEPKEKFWSKKLLTRAQRKDEENLLIPISPKKISFPKRIDNFSDFNWFKSYASNDEHYDFLHRVFSEGELILYAQREFLYLYFSNYKQELLYGNNTPYDWDHISPYSWIKNKKNIFEPLKTWYNTNGNFRAWPLSLNRQNQDDAPAQKLSITEEDFTDEIIPYLSQQNCKIKYSENILCDWSCCDEEWLEVDNEDLTDTKNAKELLKLIMNRGIEIYKIWYYELYTSIK